MGRSRRHSDASYGLMATTQRYLSFG
jgi:hypothetical protein